MMRMTTDPIRRTPRRRARRSALTLVDARGDPSAVVRESVDGPAQLIADLAALVDAGLIAPVERHGAVRYAVADHDQPAA